MGVIMANRIPDGWHKEPAFNCLSAEDFLLLQNTHEVGEEFSVDDNDCECEKFTLDGYHRCDCGNRRCNLVCEEYRGEKYFRVEVF